MSLLTPAVKTVVGEPEVVEDDRANTPLVEDGRPVEEQPAWLALKDAATALQQLQAQDGSVPEIADHAEARVLATTVAAAIRTLAPRLGERRPRERAGLRAGEGAERRDPHGQGRAPGGARAQGHHPGPREVEGQPHPRLGRAGHQPEDDTQQNKEIWAIVGHGAHFFLV